MNPQTQNEINELLFRLLDNEISDADLLRLSNWLGTDPQAKSYYCQFMEDTSVLTMRASVAIEDRQQAQESDILGEHFWKQMYEEEKNAPALEVITEKEPLPEPPVRVERKQASRTISKVSLAAAVLSAAALLLIIVTVHLSPPAPYEVATVYDAMDAQWSSGLPLEPGTRIDSHWQPILLTRGILKLITDEHVEIVLEGPTEFKFISYSEISLNHGKLFARVSEQGLGFSVATPNSKIVDLGTEFGVLCHRNGDTEVYMYKGRANLFAGQKNENKISQLLLAGSAKKVNCSDSLIKEIPLEEDAVVRTIDSQAAFIWRGQSLNLADLVGGGDGFGTGQLNRGIEIATGRFIQHLPTTDTLPGPNEYIPASGVSYIDGVFVPGMRPGGTQIASTGLRTDAFPKTSGMIWGYIFNGAWHSGFDVPPHNLHLNGIVLDGRRNPAITMHSNLGMTFDLSAIRRTLPGVRICSLSSMFGVSETAVQSLKMRDFRDLDQTPGVVKLAAERQSTAEFWVFLDGKKVFQQAISSGSKGGRLTIPLDEDVRFLTLAVTESDDTFMFDWAVFVQPELILESAE